MKLVYLILSFLVFLGVSSLAQSPAQFVKKTSNSENNLLGLSSSPFKSSVQPIADLRFWDLLSGGALPNNVQKFKDRKWIQGKLKFSTYKSHSDNPWMFFIPGIFSYLDSSFVVHMARQFQEQGFNVVVVPNRLTWTFHKAKPKFAFGDLQSEADLHCALVRQIRVNNKISTPFDLWGMSYGGLLSAAVASRCAEQFNKLTIVSPPVNLLNSLKRVLTLIEQSWHTNANLHKSVSWWLYVRARMGLVDYQQIFSRFFMDGLFYNIFLNQKDLQDLNFSYDSREYHLWQSETSLKSFYIDGLRAEELEVRDLSLKYWLRRVSNQKIPFYVLAASDDPINAPEDWRPLLTEFTEKEIGLLPQGGHMGFVDSEWFEQFLNIRSKGSVNED